MGDIFDQIHTSGPHSTSGDVFDQIHATTTPPPDPLERALNYRTGTPAIDFPMGVVQGAAKGAIEHIHSGARMLQNLPPVKAADDAYAKLTGAVTPTDEQWKQQTAANGLGQGTGKFLEGAAEFAVPAAKVGSALKGAGLAARAIGQAGVGAGVSAVQSGGDPASMAIGGTLGGAGELTGPAIRAGKALLAQKSPTLANFSESFGGATPTQKARISKSLGTLQRDGIVPPDSVHEAQDAIKGKLADLSQAYQNLDPSIKARPLDPSLVVNELRAAQAPYMRRGVVTDSAAHSAIERQIQTVQDIAAANDGVLTLDDLLHMKQAANGRTNFQSINSEKSLWNNVGNAYRSAADTLAPETTPLNRDYQKYKDLEQVIDQNIARGKGTSPSGLDALLQRAVQHGVGATVGAGLGHVIGGPTGSAIGGLVGSFVGPKVGKIATQAVRNAADSGALPVIPEGLKYAAKKAIGGMGQTVLSSSDLRNAGRQMVLPAAAQIPPDDRQQLGAHSMPPLPDPLGVR